MARTQGYHIELTLERGHPSALIIHEVIVDAGESRFALDLRSTPFMLEAVVCQGWRHEAYEGHGISFQGEPTASPQLAVVEYTIGLPVDRLGDQNLLAFPEMLPSIDREVEVDSDLPTVAVVIDELLTGQYLATRLFEKPWRDLRGGHLAVTLLKTPPFRADAQLADGTAVVMAWLDPQSDSDVTEGLARTVHIFERLLPPLVRRLGPVPFDSILVLTDGYTMHGLVPGGAIVRIDHAWWEAPEALLIGSVARNLIRAWWGTGIKVTEPGGRIVLEGVELALELALARELGLPSVEFLEGEIAPRAWWRFWERSRTMTMDRRRSAQIARDLLRDFDEHGTDVLPDRTRGLWGQRNASVYVLQQLGVG